MTKRQDATKPAADMGDDQILGNEEAAEAIRVSKYTLNQWRVRDTGPSYLTGHGGRFIGYRLGDIRRWIARSRHATISDPIDVDAGETQPNLASISGRRLAS